MGNQLLKTFEVKRQKPAFSTAEIDSWVLPSWFIKQSDPLSPGYVFGKCRFANLCYRNWTAFCNENGEPVLIVDREGTISFPKIGVSIEVWVNDGNTFFTPGRFIKTEQKAAPEFLCIETKSIFQNGIYKSRIFPIEGRRNLSIGFELELYAAGEDAFSNYLIFLVVRPYDHNGLAAINRLEYKNRRLKLNNLELLQFETEPKMVFCTHAGVGDVTEYFKLEQNNLSVTAMNGSCTGLAGYSIRPADQTQIKLLFKPDFSKMFAKQEGDFSNKWLIDSKQIWLSRYIFQHRMLRTGSEIDLIYHNNLNYLKMFNGSSFGLVDVYHILALNRFAFFTQSRICLLKALKKVHWDGSLSFGSLTPAKLIFALADYYQFSGDQKFLRDNWLVLKRVGFWLVQNQGYLTNNLHREYSEDSVWPCASLRALSMLSEVNGDYQNFQFFHQHYQELWSRILGFFSRKFKENSSGSCRARPASEGVASLCLSYPLQLFQKNEKFIGEWLNQIVEKATFNSGIISPMEFQGVDLELTARLGVILLREGREYDSVFKLLSGTVSSTGSWPDRIHPVFGGGIGITGHAPEVCCHFLLLLRNIMVMEEGEVLYLLPGIFTSKIWRCLSIELRRFPTTFGEISLKCQNIGEIVQIEFNACFRKKPQKIRLILNACDRMLYSDSGITQIGECVELEPNFKIVRLRRGSS